MATTTSSENLPEEEIFPPHAPPAPKSQRTETRVTILSSYWIVILLSLPLWWYTTSIQRLHLPTARILNHAEKSKLKMEFPVRLVIVPEGHIAESSDSFRAALDKECLSREELQFLSIEYGSAIPSATTAVVPQYTLILKDKKSNPNLIVQERSLVVPYDHAAGVKANSQQACQMLSQLWAPHPTKAEQLRVTQYSPRYRVAFSLLNEDASVGDAASSWDVARAIAENLSSSIQQLSVLYNFTIESQVQFHAPLAFEPIPSPNVEEPAFLLTEDHLKVFINSAEWTLSSSVSNDPVLHFILFVPSSTRRPLLIADSNGHPTSSSAFTIPQWGGIVISNPIGTPVNSSHSSRPPLFHMTSRDLSSAFTMFDSQLRALVGVPSLPKSIPPSSMITGWQLDALIRRRIQENERRGVEALSSIIKLVDRIKGMPVGEAVRSDVNHALDALDELHSAVHSSSLEDKLLQSARALTYSSKAFFNPEMVAMLYFPAEHQYAVYTPLFAPVAVPLVVVALRELIRWRKERAGGLSKTKMEMDGGMYYRLAAKRFGRTNIITSSLNSRYTIHRQSFYQRSHGFSNNAAPSEGPNQPDKPDVDQLPVLPRPLGVLQRPSTLGPTWEDRKKDLLDREKHLEKRRHLIKEATKGYFEDFHKTMKGHGGKIWLAPKAMIREDKALYFPDISGKSLTGEKTRTTTLCADHISVVALLSTQVAQEHVKSITDYTVGLYKDNPLFKFVQLNLQENMLKSFLVSLGRSSLRRTIPEQFHHSYIHTTQNLELLRQPIGAENKHIGFVYLVDQNLKIRWAACGYAKDEEAHALANCTRVSLERLHKVGSGLDGDQTSE